MLRADEIDPKDEDDKVALGAFRLTILNAFVLSARNWRLTFSLILKSRKIPRSTLRNPGASRIFRPTVPLVPITLGTKAAVLNHSATVAERARLGSSVACTPGTRFGRSLPVLPSRLLSLPVEKLYGSPLFRVIMGEMDHPLATCRSSPYAPW